MNHPFGFDWEFQLALDDAYGVLLSPANVQGEGGNPILMSAALGFGPRALLGLEWDKGLLPRSFRGHVNHGDRAAVFGRWILDTGHDYDGFFRTEIHPPLLVATGSVVTEHERSQFTRVLFMSRPYLPGQTYSVDLAKIYDDHAPDDGAFFNRLLNEIWSAVVLESAHVEVHPKIKSRAFEGDYRLHFIVRPPPPPDSHQYRLLVPFQFTVRTGCNVEITSTAADHIDVIVTLSPGYTPPPLPHRNERTYSRDELDRLSPGVGFQILELEVVTGLIAANFPWGGILLSAWVEYVLSNGIITDEYETLPEFDIRDATNAVWNAYADNIPAGKGIVPGDDEPYPVYGWLETRWVRVVRPTLTETDINVWVDAVLADPDQARRLKQKNWVQVLLSEFEATREQVDSLMLVPPACVSEVQKAIGLSWITEAPSTWNAPRKESRHTHREAKGGWQGWRAASFGRDLPLSFRCQL